MPITQQGAFYTGKYRNLFKELGFSEDQINAKLEETWSDLFYGDPNVRIYYPLDEEKAIFWIQVIWMLGLKECPTG